MVIHYYLVLIEPGIYVYYNATYQKNQDPPHLQPGRYSTDVVAESALEYLEDAAADQAGRPFFVNLMPVGPHFEAVYPDEGSIAGNVLYPPVPAKRHEHLFPDAKVPRTENFNPEMVSFLFLTDVGETQTTHKIRENSRVNRAT